MFGLDPVYHICAESDLQKNQGRDVCGTGERNCIFKETMCEGNAICKGGMEIELGSRVLMSHLRSQGRSGLPLLTYLLYEGITFIWIVLKCFMILCLFSCPYLYSYCQETNQQEPYIDDENY